MDTVKNNSINSKHLKNHTIMLGTTAIILIIGLYWILSHVNERVDYAAPTLSNISYMAITLFLALLYPIAACLGAWWALQTAHGIRNNFIKMDTGYRGAWLLMGLALLASCLSGIVNVCVLVYTASQTTLYQWLHLAPAFTNAISVVCGLFFYPLAFGGLLLMPGIHRLRPSLLLDMLITAFCVIGICWYFVVSPANIIALQAHYATSPPLSLMATSIIYPFCDIFLFLTFVLILQKGVAPMLRFSSLLLALGFVANLYGDASRAYVEIYGATNGGYQPGSSFMNVFLFVGSLLIGLSALFQYNVLTRKSQSEDQVALKIPVMRQPFQHIRVRAWPHMQHIYIPLSLILGFLILLRLLGYNANDPTQVLSMVGLIVLAVLSVGLLTTRHFYTMHENEVLLQEREQHYSESEHVRQLITQMIDIHDMNYLRELIVHTVLPEFGFTAAMLVLVEEYDNTPTSQSHLLISAASLSVDPMKWRLRGDNILFHTILEGRRAEVQWTQHIPDTPPEIRIWLDKQHVVSMVFFPITFCGKVLGCLGVARHPLAHSVPAGMKIVSMYAEQIAALIAHGYLYQEAQEHEAFARAMANISTRLNAAVVEPVEISQLICNEGIKALRADYVIFYRKQEDGDLVPLTVAVSDPERAQLPEDWPSFPISDYEAGVVNSTQPILIDMAQKRNAQTIVLTSSESTGGTPIMSVRSYTVPRLLALRNKMGRYFVQTAIMAPLVAGGRIIGLLIFARAVKRGVNIDQTFDVSDLPHAQDFVKQAGITFANAQLYQDLRTTHERLKELDQLKDQFMITASHELRTPLTTVQGYIELIALYDETLPPEQRRDFLQKAQLGCEELAVLLRNVMDASRLEAEAGIKPALISRVSVKEIVEKVQVMIEPKVTHERRQVIVKVPAHLQVYADPVRLHQVLMNVSTNALKYSPPGTPITFVGRIFVDQGRYIIISIVDKGKGIDPQDQPHLFQRFYRLEADMNSPVRGSGLGLYISRRLVEAMGGKIWIESSGVTGEGSTFHMQLPMA